MKKLKVTNVFKVNNSFKINRLAIAGMLVITAVSGCSSINTQEAPALSPEGMSLVINTRSTLSYKKEGVNFSDYTKIQISPSEVAFKKNWERDYNRDQASLSTRLRDKDVVNIKNKMAQLFDETFAEEFLKDSNYPLVAEPESGTLLLRPAIINLDVNAPDVTSAANNKTYVDSAGQATLYLEIYDAVSGEILARIIDAEESRTNGHYQWANRVSNRADAKIIIKRWAHALREAFDKAHAQ